MRYSKRGRLLVRIRCMTLNWAMAEIKWTWKWTHAKQAFFQNTRCSILPPCSILPRLTIVQKRSYKKYDDSLITVVPSGVMSPDQNDADMACTWTFCEYLPNQQCVKNDTFDKTAGTSTLDRCRVLILAPSHCSNVYYRMLYERMCGIDTRTVCNVNVRMLRNHW